MIDLSPIREERKKRIQCPNNFRFAWPSVCYTYAQSAMIEHQQLLNGNAPMTEIRYQTTEKDKKPTKFYDFANSLKYHIISIERVYNFFKMRFYLTTTQPFSFRSFLVLSLF